MKALIFDMDGTLTPATEPISPEMIDTLKKVSPGSKKYLVSGSDILKIEKQIPQEFLLNYFAFLKYPHLNTYFIVNNFYLRRCGLLI
jgi:hydroxymethylpyrimidine pyrophosphatase-like HAD family hydrolase